MATLFQVHCNLDTLKAKIIEVSQLWHAGDRILLLGTTIMYVDWIQAYLEEINFNDEVQNSLTDIANVFVLQTDLNEITDTAKNSIEFFKFNHLTITLLTDHEWVEETLKAEKVVTLN